MFKSILWTIKNSGSFLYHQVGLLYRHYRHLYRYRWIDGYFLPIYSFERDLTPMLAQLFPVLCSTCTLNLKRQGRTLAFNGHVALAYMLLNIAVRIYSPSDTAVGEVQRGLKCCRVPAGPPEVQRCTFC